VTEKVSEDLTEAQVRALRDLVYEVASTDDNWNATKQKWMTPESLRWLQERTETKAS